MMLRRVDVAIEIWRTLYRLKNIMSIIISGCYNKEEEGDHAEAQKPNSAMMEAKNNGI